MHIRCLYTRAAKHHPCIVFLLILSLSIAYLRVSCGEEDNSVTGVAVAPGNHPGQVLQLDLSSGQVITLAWCPGGSFLMGMRDGGKYGLSDEKPLHEVKIKCFWIGVYEVSQKQWREVMASEPWKWPPDGNPQNIKGTLRLNLKEGDDYPACYITFNEAARFCADVTAREQKSGRLPSNWIFALPKEDQWEYACRAGTESYFYFGDDPQQVSEHAWWSNLEHQVGNCLEERYPHQIGKKKPNPWNIHDMAGNVAEWCDDKLLLYNKSSIPVKSEQYGRETSRVIRGGSWDKEWAGCLSGSRASMAKIAASSSIGFRIILVERDH